MGMKSIIKKMIPQTMINRFRHLSNGSLTLYSLALSQAHRFNKAYGKYNPRERKQIEAQMVFYAHQIEKGLSHTDFRYGFGHVPLKQLQRIMTLYRKANPSYLNSIPYQSALAALHEYAIRHADHQSEFAYAQNLFPDSVWNEAAQAPADLGGSIVITADSKKHNSEKTFTELSTARHSIREYSDQPVTQKELNTAIQIAMHTPSVCNRQPARVKVILEPSLIKEALKIQGGFNGYQMPPALLLITADNHAFLSPQEHDEGFIDGGLFSMSLLLSLEEEGLAACPLNTMFNKKADRVTRTLLQIPNNENFVMYIAVGHFPESVKTCRSARLTSKEITTVYE